MNNPVQMGNNQNTMPNGMPILNGNKIDQNSKQPLETKKVSLGEKVAESNKDQNSFFNSV